VTEETNPRRPRRTARRAVTALAAAGVAALALSACQVQPGAAAFVGGDRISRSDVDKVTDSVKGGSGSSFGGLRQETVAALVTANLADRVARDRGVTVKAPDYRAAQETVRLLGGAQLPTSSPYVRAVAEADAAIDALREQAQPATLSDQDLRILLGILELNGNVQQGAPLNDELRTELDTPEARQAVAVRAELAAAATKYKVTINPLYGRVVYPIGVSYLNGDARSAIVLPLGSNSTGPVRTVSPAPSSDTGE
jgi:hypothetical protein